jgi:hypothetical protein
VVVSAVVRPQRIALEAIEQIRRIGGWTDIAAAAGEQCRADGEEDSHGAQLDLRRLTSRQNLPIGLANDTTMQGTDLFCAVM